MTSPTLTSVYRYYDRHDVLIYVGITKQGIGRNYQHNQRAEWWPFVVRQEVEHYESREDAARREKGLIVSFRPPFNIRHNPDYASTKAAYLAWVAAPELHSNAEHVFEQTKGILPLTTLRWEPPTGPLLLCTRAEHQALAGRIDLAGRKVFLDGQSAVVSSIEMRGIFLRIELRGKRDLPPEITSATARVKPLSQKKPATYQLRSILITPTPSAVFRKPAAT